MFPKHERHPDLADTPSTGKSEVLKAMAELHAVRPRAFRTVNEIAARINLRQDISADVATVLGTMGSSVESSGSKWRLTYKGLRDARHPRPRSIDPWHRR